MRSTYKTIRDEIRLALGNRVDQDVLIREKINAAARAIGILTQHKQLMTSTTFSTASTASTSDFEYDIASDCFAVLSVRNTTDSVPLIRDHYFALDKIDESITGKPTKYAVYGGVLYIFSPVPDSTTRTIKYRYWKLHPYIQQDNDVHSLDETWDEALKAMATSLTMTVLNRHAEASAKWQQYTAYVSMILGRPQTEDMHDQVSSVVYGR